MLKKLIITLALVLSIILIVITLGIKGAFFPYTYPVQDNVNSANQTVSELIKIEIGGMDQYVLLRGGSSSNPVLLWLHGGPGAAQMPLAHHLDKDLEQEFVVVHWDQRGAGKSNHSGFDKQTMTFDQYMSDTHELIRYLQQRFDQEKVFLIGHSWGTMLGIEYAERYPEDLHAYISVSQVVDNHRAYQIGYEWLQTEIEQADSRSNLRELEELGEPPYTEHSDHVKFAGLIGDYGGNFDISMARLARIAFRAPEYNLKDYYRWLNGANRGSGPMWDEVFAHHIDYISHIPSLDVPIYFLIGENDKNTPWELVEEYYEVIDTPQKELVVFNSSAHTPFLTEPDKFSREVTEVKKKVMEEDDIESY